MHSQLADGERARLERELEYYRREYDEIGARLLRLQEEQSRIAREARRSKIVAKLVREAYRLIGHDVEPHAIGRLILATIADTAVCDCAVFLRIEPSRPNCFVVEHTFGTVRSSSMLLAAPPDFLFTSARQSVAPQSAGMTELLAAPYVLWAYDQSHGRALLLGNRIESNIHRAFEAGDRELVEVALGVYIDVLMRKVAEAALRQAKLAAEHANTVRAQFLATLSHEFRSPLEAVIGFSELLAHDGGQAPSAAQRSEYVHQILDSGRRLLALVKDILDFSRFETLVPLLRIDWVPVAQLLQNAVRGLAAEAAARRVSLEIIQPAARWQVSIDYERFRQILANLIGNALKFTPPSGTIVVAARIIDDAAVEISVADNGVGIAPQDIDRVLEPFIQLANLNGRRVSGAGLGLPIAKQLTEAHGGTLRIASIVGNGTTVTVSLPTGTARLPTAES
ncbi:MULTISPECIES: sensor histidine kinase [Acidiphilium]|uniref:histidine kinase n=1 Tax=Acidiphilium rubrum TaxID=526 RepID=A0A8G2FLE8_ACIRU|nr:MULTISPECIES: HAMP domain-containing sensor histidine kinase [Acidiphilium]SIQ78304.1 Signal transduction histidine kinase [Acidiphilium rubrum]